MSLLSDKRVLGLFVGFIVSAVAFLGVAAVGVLSGLAATTAPEHAGDPLLHVLVETLLPFVVAALALGVISLAFLAGLVWVLATNLDLESRQLADLAERAEREVDALRRLGLSDRLAPNNGTPAGRNSTG